ncbi:MAG TPA: NAD(P)-binding domain-containing protein, partial [Tissierellaceae bacterium]
MKYGFIGSGNMSEAIIAGMIKSGKYNSKDINVSSRNMNTLLNFKTRYNINDLSSNKELAKLSDIIIIAVKPNMYDIVL